MMAAPSSSLVSLADVNVNRRYVLIEDYHAKQLHFADSVELSILEELMKKFNLHGPNDLVTIWSRPFQRADLNGLLRRFVIAEDRYMIDPQEMVKEGGWTQHIFYATPRASE